MAITFPLSLPNLTDIAGVTMRQRSVVAVTPSPFSLKVQTQVHAGQRFEADIILRTMTTADREVWNAFLGSLNGMEGTFLLGDPNRATALGEAGGTPLVKGASQTGGTLAIDGATVSQTGWLKAGDYFQLGTGSGARLFKLLVDADTDGLGEVTMDMWPDLRSSPGDNAPLVINSAVGRFRLGANEIAWTVSPSDHLYRGNFAAIEAF